MEDKTILAETAFIDLDEDDLDYDELQPSDKDAYFEREKLNPVHHFTKRNILTKERYDNIIRYIGNACHPTHAAMAVGISPKTLGEWLALGDQYPNSIYGLFLHDFMKAFGTVITTNETILQGQAVEDFKALKFLLEKWASGVYGESAKKIEISGPNGLPVEVKQEAVKEVVITSDELAKMLQYEQQVEELNALPDKAAIEKEARLRAQLENAVDADMSLRLGSEADIPFEDI